MKQVNDELNAMRKAEKIAAMSLENKAEKDRILEGLNKSKYSFIKNEDSLNETQIVGYFDGKTTSGTVEGINNKLKLIKKLGYGFRNFSNFRLRSLLNWHFSINFP